MRTFFKQTSTGCYKEVSEGEVRIKQKDRAEGNCIDTNSYYNFSRLPRHFFLQLTYLLTKSLFDRQQKVSFFFLVRKNIYFFLDLRARSLVNYAYLIECTLLAIKKEKFNDQSINLALFCSCLLWKWRYVKLFLIDLLKDSKKSKRRINGKRNEFHLSLVMLILYTGILAFLSYLFVGQ